MLYDLMNMDITGVNLREFTRTEALFDQILESMTPIQAWWFGRLKDGCITTITLQNSSRDQWWPSEMPNSKLYMDFEIYCNRRKLYLPDERVFGRQLFELLGKSQKIRKVFDESREWGKTIPPLEECREHFSTLVDMPIDWVAE